MRHSCRCGNVSLNDWDMDLESFFKLDGKDQSGLSSATSDHLLPEFPV